MNVTLLKVVLTWTIVSNLPFSLEKKGRFIVEFILRFMLGSFELR